MSWNPPILDARRAARRAAVVDVVQEAARRQERDRLERLALRRVV